MGRITALIGSGKFYSDLGIDKLNPQTDRIMICGSMHMLKDVKELAESLGFQEGSLSHPATFVVEPGKLLHHGAIAALKQGAPPKKPVRMAAASSTGWCGRLRCGRAKPRPVRARQRSSAIRSMC